MGSLGSNWVLCVSCAPQARWDPWVPHMFLELRSSFACTAFFWLLWVFDFQLSREPYSPHAPWIPCVPFASLGSLGSMAHDPKRRTLVIRSVGSSGGEPERPHAPMSSKSFKHIKSNALNQNTYQNSHQNTHKPISENTS